MSCDPRHNYYVNSLSKLGISHFTVFCHTMLLCLLGHCTQHTYSATVNEYVMTVLNLCTGAQGCTRDINVCFPVETPKIIFLILTQRAGECLLIIQTLFQLIIILQRVCIKD